MDDQRREILSKVREGTLSPEEAAVRLEELEAGQDSEAADDYGPEDTRVDAADPGIKVVRLVKQRGPAIVVGDPTIRGAVADGPHSISTDDDTILITSEEDDEAGIQFGFGPGFGPGRYGRIRTGRPLHIRMNPVLALHAEIQAGTLRVERVTGPIQAEVQAGSARIEGFRETIDLSVQAGSVRATGRLTTGTSRVQCEAGNVRIELERGSSVRVNARSTLGRVALRGRGVDHNVMVIGRGGREAVFGRGDAALEIDATMGSVRVECDE
jgi:hypothetical protein